MNERVPVVAVGLQGEAALQPGRAVVFGYLSRAAVAVAESQLLVVGAPETWVVGVVEAVPPEAAGVVIVEVVVELELELPPKVQMKEEGEAVVVAAVASAVPVPLAAASTVLSNFLL